MLHTFPNGMCDQSWPVMVYQDLVSVQDLGTWSKEGQWESFYGIWPTITGRKKLTLSGWLLSHDNIAPGLMADTSTAVSCSEEACLCWEKRKIGARAANSGSPDDRVWAPEFSCSEDSSCNAPVMCTIKSYKKCPNVNCFATNIQYEFLMRTRGISVLTKSRHSWLENKWTVNGSNN